MIEQFYSIDHLTTEQLRELYTDYHSRGWVDFEYHLLIHEGINRPTLSDDKVTENITAGDKHNYFVFMLSHEHEQDGVMIGFGLKDYPLFGAYLHLEPELLEEIVSKYSLTATNNSVTAPLIDEDIADEDIDLVS